MQKFKARTLPYSLHKSHLKMYQRKNLKPETSELPEESIMEAQDDTNFGKLLGKIPEEQA